MPEALKHIGIVLFEDVEELDAVGPWEVLLYWTRNFPDDGYAGRASHARAVPPLHLVARLAGRERARDVRRGIQYDPEPPVERRRELVGDVSAPPAAHRLKRDALQRISGVKTAVHQPQ